MNPSRVFPRLLATLLLSVTAAELAALEARLVGPEGKCLGTETAPASLAPLALSACGDAADSRQRFTLPARGFAGEIRLGGLCLDVDHSETEDHTPIQLFSCHGGANQRWQHDSLGRLVGLGGKCLDLAAGGGSAEGPAALSSCGNQGTQTFLAEPYQSWGLTHVQSASGAARLLPTADATLAYQQDGENLLRSSDAGRTWVTVSSWNGSGLIVAVDYQHPDRLWRITDSRKLWRSDDGGRSWRALALASENLELLLVSRVDPRVLVALSESGLWLSRDSGLTFARHAGLPGGPFFLRFPHVLVENEAGEWLFGELRYCGSGGASCDGALWVTGDFGQTWQASSELFAAGIVLAASATERQTVYLLEKSGRVSRSTDGGRHFAPAGLVPGPSFGAFPIALAVDPTDSTKVWAVFDSRLFYSEDAGANWLETAGSLLAGADFEPQSVSALGGGNLLVLATRKNDQLRRAVISRDGGANWAVETAGIAGGGGALVAAASPGRYYSWTRYLLLRTDDYGRVWQQSSPRPCLRAVVADPVEPSTLYYSAATSCAGQQGEVPGYLWRSRDAGATFENISPPGISRELTLLQAVRRGDATLLLTADESNGGLLWRSADGGGSWQQVTAASQTVYGLLADAGTIWATSGRALSQSSDGGATWGPYGGPDYFVVGGGKRAYLDESGQIVVERGDGSIVRSPSPSDFPNLQLDRHGRLYLVGESSLFRSRDDGRTWQDLETGVINSHFSVVADPYDLDLLLGYGHGTSGPRIGRFGDETVLSLGRGRFQATIGWRAPDGTAGRGKGKNLTDDSGGFYFFSPERTEVVVKVLDGRPINGRFWVFVGSLTDVEFDLEVVDQVSGEKRRYHNAASSFASFGDTQAFPLGEAQPSSEAVGPTFYYPATSGAVAVGDHFGVEVAWQTADGQGVGMGRRLSGETAAFTFFSPENVELLVNVLDGRALNGHYWVFAGSLSDVAYTLRVRNLETGEVKEYRNPAGAFASFGDTSAF